MAENDNRFYKVGFGFTYIRTIFEANLWSLMRGKAFNHQKFLTKNYTLTPVSFNKFIIVRE